MFTNAKYLIIIAHVKDTFPNKKPINGHDH